MSGGLADFLDSAPDLHRSQLSQFGGFGGLHGGLAAALVARSMGREIGARCRLVSITVSFLRPISGRMNIVAADMSPGRNVHFVKATGVVDGARVMVAEGVFESEPLRADPRGIAPVMPADIVARAEAEVFRPPPEFVPISTRMEIRLAADNLPYTGGTDPMLCAWIRLTEAVSNPAERLLILADALAPSYAATLTDLRPIPTVSMTVYFTDPGNAPDFEWVLVRAETIAVTPGGWLHEDLTIWAEDGTCLANATQLRLVR